MHGSAVLLELGLMVLGLAALSRLAGRLGIPAVPLYLLAGLAFGDGGIVPLGASEEFVRVGAEIGLVLLLFLLGLEYSARELTKALADTHTAGLVDLSANFVPGFAAGLLLGWGPLPSAFLGGATYVSSSGIAARILADLRFVGAVRRHVLSILVVEDLAMAMFLPLLGALLSKDDAFRAIMLSVFSVGAVAGVLALAYRFSAGISRWMFSRSDEALLLTILGFGFAIAGLAEAIQVSAAVGGLIAGIALSGPTSRNAMELLKPVRDLFAAIFFAFIGLSIDPSSFGPVLLTAMILAVVTIGTKFVTGLAIGGRRAAVPVGAILVARGEFSLALAGLAVAANVDPSPAPLIVAYVLILAVAGPLGARLVRSGRADP